MLPTGYSSWLWLAIYCLPISLGFAQSSAAGSAGQTTSSPTVEITTVPQLLNEINLDSQNLSVLNQNLTTQLSLAPHGTKVQVATAWVNQNQTRYDDLGEYLLELYLAVPADPIPTLPLVTSYPASFSPATVQFLNAGQQMRLASTDALSQTAQGQISLALDALTQEAKQKPFAYVSVPAPSFLNAAQVAAWNQKQTLDLARETLRYNYRYSTDAVQAQMMNGWLASNQAQLDQLNAVIAQAYLTN